MSFAIGENVGPYRIVEQLGQGGMATVFKAYHAALDRYVAIKVLHRAFLEDPNFLARFQREARVVAKLEHPNIVPIYDFSEHGGQPYLVMKFIEGETLKARLQRGPLSRDEGLQIIQAVGAGLAYAHGRGILHRDIKPSNVLLTPDGGIYLADFGLARIAQAGESTLSSDMMLGTPQYISPEQARGERDLDAGTDIYSFGVVLYEMVVGRVPFSADTPFSIIHDHIYTPLPLPRSINPRVPDGVERVLLKALAKDRADRFESVGALVAAFSAAISGASMPAMPDLRTLTEPVPTTRRRPGPEVTAVAGEAAPLELGPSARKKPSWGWIAGGLAVTCLCLAAFAFAASREGEQSAIAGQTETDPLEAARAAVEAEPGNPNLRMDLATLYRERGQAAAAAEQFEKAGSLLLDRGNYAAAAKALAEALDLFGGPVNAPLTLSSALVQSLTLGAEDPETWPIADRAARQYPQIEWIAAASARSAMYAGEMELARSILDRALNARPEDPLANAILAEWFYLSADPVAAQRQLDSAQESVRRLPWLREYLVALRQKIETGA